MKDVRTIGLFLVVAILAVGSDLAYPDHKPKHKPGEPGGQLTTNLMEVVFSNRIGDQVMDDGMGAYKDERATDATEVDKGVEAFLFGSGNLGTVSGFISMVHQIAGGLGAFAGAIIFDLRGSYDAALMLMLGLAIVAAVMTLLVREGPSRAWAPASRTSQG